MKKLTLLFSGQGSQYVGMGQKFDDQHSDQVFQRASEVLGYDLKDLCFNGPKEKLTLTQNTQPALVTYSYILFQKLISFLMQEKIDYSIDCVLGHSVGEYSALLASETFSLEQAVLAVSKRGEYMQSACPPGEGTMYALLKLPEDIIKQACDFASTENISVMPANFNEPNQTVISGHKLACDKAVVWLKENVSDPFRAVELAVSAPFHSALMLPAQEKMKELFETMDLSANKFNYIPNITHKIEQKNTNPDIIKGHLINQVTGSVYWHQSFEHVDKDSYFIEIGPSKVLTGLNRKIDRSMKTFSLDSLEKISELKEKLC